MSAKLAELLGINMSEKRPNVRRCLYGRPDPVQLDKDLHKQVEEMTEANAKRMRERYGFDPITGKPVAGGEFECTEVSNKEYVPQFYRKGYSQKIVRPKAGKLAAKRKLDFLEESDLNDENRADLDSRVPSNGNIVPSITRFQQHPTQEYRSSCSDSCGLPCAPSVSPSLSGLSPLPRQSDMITPPSRSKGLTQSQSTIPDFLPVKKQKIQPKALPRS